MEFTVNSQVLVKELGLLAGVVDRGSSTPVLSNVLIETAFEEDAIWLTATDLQTSLRVKIAAAVMKPGASTLPAKRLLDYVKLLPGGDVHIKFGDTHWASLECSSAKCRMAGITSDSFPELPQRPHPHMEMPIGVLATLIARTTFAISAEESRFTLNGALLEMDGERALMVATDGHRLSLDCVKASVDSAVRVLLPQKAAAQLAKLASLEDPKTPVLFARDSNHLFFELGSRTLIAREMSGNFPDYARALPTEAQQPHCVKLQREDLLGAIERVREFADERTQMIRLKFAADELTVAAAMEAGDSEESVPVEYSGPEVEIGFCAAYLVEFLRAATEAEVTFRFKDREHPGELRPAADGDGYRYVVMPMRI